MKRNPVSGGGIKMANAANFLIGGNDEHGVNPPTTGKRTPVMPYLGRSIYENEFNRAAKIAFLTACVRCGFNVYDVKPEERDISVSTRVSRVNAAGVSLVVTFAYNASGSGTTFNSANGFQVFFSYQNARAAESRTLSYNISAGLAEEINLYNRGVATLNGVGMLSSVRCPASLVEAGFMTNFAEAKLMLDPDFVRSVAEGATKGVCRTLDVAYVPSIALGALPTVRSGSRNRYVRYLQWLLVGEGYQLNPDGIFGNATLRAVRQFQADNGLTADGIVGRNTWAALTTRSSPLPLLRRGSRGRYVRYLQRKLLAKLYPVGTPDGIFGANTERAVKAFQTENGLTPDGLVGSRTWALLTRVGGGRPMP